MKRLDLQAISQTVVSRARRQGYVLPREIRQELTHAGVPDTRWKDVLALARSRLRYRQGRYYFVSAVTARLREEQRNLHSVQRAVREMLREYRAAASRRVERRRHRRLYFFGPATVQTADRRELRLLTHDISISGIRLIAPCSLLGQKIRVLIPAPANSHIHPWGFRVQILWAYEAGDDLFENGGVFLGLAPDGPEPLRIVAAD